MGNIVDCCIAREHDDGLEPASRSLRDGRCAAKEVAPEEPAPEPFLPSPVKAGSEQVGSDLPRQLAAIARPRLWRAGELPQRRPASSVAAQRGGGSAAASAAEDAVAGGGSWAEAASEATEAAKERPRSTTPPSWARLNAMLGDLASTVGALASRSPRSCPRRVSPRDGGVDIEVLVAEPAVDFVGAEAAEAGGTLTPVSSSESPPSPRSDTASSSSVPKVPEDVAAASRDQFAAEEWARSRGITLSGGVEDIYQYF